MELLKVGDRVRRAKLFGEGDRLGTVVECYASMPGLNGPGQPMVAVQWDGPIERGYFNSHVGSLEKVSDQTKKAT